MTGQRPVKTADDIMKKKTVKDESVLLDEAMETSDAGALLVRLKTIIESKNSFILDGSQVKVIDTAILQLLVVLFSETQQRDIRVTWQQPSDSLCKSAGLLGLQSHLCLESI
jgi:anti-anti-sigma regulatory factor